MTRQFKRVALYCRVSTEGQQTAQQQDELERWAETNGHKIIQTYIDHGISGAKSREQRPQLDLMLKACAAGRHDCVAVWAIDRLGRSLRDLVLTLDELQHCEIAFVSLQQSIDSSSPAGRMMLGIVGSFAEFERAMIRERTIAGLKRARKAGKKLGRPRIPYETRQRARELSAQGMSQSAIARQLMLSRGTVQRVIRDGGHAQAQNASRRKGLMPHVGNSGE